MDWQPIKDAPWDERVLVSRPGTNAVIARYLRFTEQEIEDAVMEGYSEDQVASGWKDDTEDYKPLDFEPTHFMPLPDPPQVP